MWSEIETNLCNYPSTERYAVIIGKATSSLIEEGREGEEGGVRG